MNHSRKGFSVLEAVITIFIFGVIFLLYQAATNTIFLSKNAKDQEIAIRIANNKIENLRAAGYDSLPSSGSFSDPQLVSLIEGSASMEITDYNSSTKQVVVNVQWREAKSQQDISLTTLITREGGL